ncbi:thioredoxin reductase [Lachnospiraceae bacterium KM106-2]|nr:thioredoxin reductase [Lachnospiraceae bacterium KM106-2]
MKQYDLIIVGSGPAGLSASIYARRAEISTLVIEKSPMSGGQIVNTYEVDNYPGIPEISGFDLAMKFRKHSDALGATFVEGDVVQFRVEDQNKYITLGNGDTYRCKAIIIATGAVSRHLNIPGEDRLSGMGVSYCATCDGAFFRNKIVAVVGGGDTALEDAIFLSRLCAKVYIIHRRHEFRAVKSLCSSVEKASNIEVMWNSKVKEIRGEEQVESLLIQNIVTEENNILQINGLFIAIGTVPNSELYRDIVSVDNSGYIIAGEDCRTNVPGIFAAGDIRTKQLKQVITAAADGANAITSVERYFSLI